MGAFNIGLSGLSAASKDLDVTSNNIANAETVGFKKSRSEFADIYALNAFGSAKTQSGSGVTTQSVSQHFNQGNLNFTENTLDMAVTGQGFFVLQPNLTNDEQVFTRAGAFQVNQDGFVVNSQEQFLMGYPVAGDGTVLSTSLASAQPIQLPQTSGAPAPTSEVGLSVNLNFNATQPVDNATPPVALDFDPNDSDTYNFSTSVNVYDSLGSQHTATYYFVKGGVPGAGANQQWDVHATVDGFTDAAGTNPTDPITDGNLSITSGLIEFGTDGSYQAGTSTAVLIDWQDIPGVDNLLVPTSFGPDGTKGLPGSTQFAQANSVIGLHQDGYASGRLTGVDISDNGLVQANYSNGTSRVLNKVALANFANPQGLRQLGDTNWVESLDSGEALAGEAGTSVFGFIKSGALEQSNVDLTSELVHLIVAQRNFQANAKSIETASRVTETVINIR